MKKKFPPKFLFPSKSIDLTTVHFNAKKLKQKRDPILEELKSNDFNGPI